MFGIIKESAYPPLMGPRPAQEAWKSIVTLFLEGEAHRRMHDVCAEIGLNPGLMKTLITLSPDSDTPMRELTERWGVDASYVTTLVDGLEERGLATRRPHVSDRRVKTVVLTPAGKRMRERTYALLHEPPTGFVALSAVEQRQLRDLLRKVTNADPVLSARAQGASAAR